MSCFVLELFITLQICKILSKFALEPKRETNTCSTIFSTFIATKKCSFGAKQRFWFLRRPWTGLKRQKRPQIENLRYYHKWCGLWWWLGPFLVWRLHQNLKSKGCALLPRLVMLVSFRVPLAHLWMDFHSFSHWMWRSSFAFWHNVLGVLR